MVRRKRAGASYVTIPEAAGILGISEGALYERLRTENIPEEIVHWKVLAQWRFDRASLLAYVNGPEWLGEGAAGAVWVRDEDGSVTEETG